MEKTDKVVVKGAESRDAESVKDNLETLAFD